MYYSGVMCYGSEKWYQFRQHGVNKPRVTLSHVKYSAERSRQKLGENMTRHASLDAESTRRALGT